MIKLYPHCLFLVVASVLASCVQHQQPLPVVSGERIPQAAGVTEAAEPGFTPPPETASARVTSPLDQGAVGKIHVINLPGEVPLKFAYCPPGRFLMGSPASEVDRSDKEDQVEVRISRGFWLGQTEVTQGQWAALMGNNPSRFKDNADFPVEQVSWNDAQGFIQKLNEQVPLPGGWKYALPTEAQWEYACRAGTETPFHFGDTLNGTQANCNGNFPYGTSQKGSYLGKTTRVGSYAPNAWGLVDMHGNVWEWCEDWYGDKLPGGTDPVGASQGSLRVKRGGSWGEDAKYCRAADRFAYTSGEPYYSLGLRLAAVPAGAR